MEVSVPGLDELLQGASVINAEFKFDLLEADSDHHWREVDPELRICDACGLRHHIPNPESVQAIRASYNEFGATASDSADGEWYQQPPPASPTSGRTSELLMYIHRGMTIGVLSLRVPA